MATSLLSQSVRPALQSPDAFSFVCRTCQRNAATYRRTRKLLRVKVDPSFAPSKTEAQDHIIFNPPSSAPSPYDTPPKFLPKSDPRWAMYSAAASTPAASTTTPASPAAPTSILASIAAKRLGMNGPPVQSLPPVRPRYEKKYHLTQEQIEEIRRLRKEDPRQWTRVRLAEKFECSQFFVSLCCSAPEIKDEQDEELVRLKARWGRRKTEAREARQERKKLWGQDA
ncbi:unnamed protein product [Zymoseptoria tritici ST99CH_1A5]|uniref:Uncharacterized protein n=3 Tax=Zymoseptoria tritici TaxID=1047171 RepID=A0A1X7RCL4_ZYMT9|nr:unnamed protein product [Zymoseptoria tritici ST99CH_3D7]SMR41501.1 unnamed protein product [Zymoseptoria tritici ST99CH_1E4]SMR43700.1 unnamed protein product [Zymoseptoria tritici ST99CH_3D1]SMY18859.1 unnamed protein product [Zymoseptoria tritici ST99CH_1A5]